MVKDSFAGTWRLVSSDFEAPDGSTLYPWGKNAMAMIMYDGRGHMAFQAMNPDRPMFASGDMRRGTAEEIKAAFEGYYAYFGTYEVDEEEGSVTHHVRGCHFPNWVGQDQKRFYEFSGDRLILRTVPMLVDGRMFVGTVVWEREA